MRLVTSPLEVQLHLRLVLQQDPLEAHRNSIQTNLQLQAAPLELLLLQVALYLGKYHQTRFYCWFYYNPFLRNSQLQIQQVVVCLVAP